MTDKQVNELDILKAMWKPNAKRNLALLVPHVSYDRKQLKGSLNNHSWHFDVIYAFRSALDIKYEQRMKDKKPYMVWTQGPIISFDEGDTLYSRNGRQAVQVRFAQPMGWDTTVEKMYLGSVVFTEYSVNAHKHVQTGEQNCSQMEFLELLISGKNRNHSAPTTSYI